VSSNRTSSQNPGCLSGLAQLLGIHSGNQPSSALSLEDLPYRLRDDFLSPAEKSFYQVLKNVLGDDLAICSKVSLGDIFFVARPNENKSAYNRINRKHVDFLVCDPKTMVPCLGIELDDSSHQRQDRVERDAFVEAVFAAANLPLLHVPVRMGYNTTEISALVKQKIGRPVIEHKPAPLDQPQADPSTEAGQGQAPFCPRCGDRMLLRIARTGDKAGQKFYGCPNYPKCRTTLPVEGW
jgi:hypothetical protein